MTKNEYLAHQFNTDIANRLHTEYERTRNMSTDQFYQYTVESIACTLCAYSSIVYPELDCEYPDALQFSEHMVREFIETV